MPHLQIKNMDPKLYHALQKRAKREHRPVSRQVIHILFDYLRATRSPAALTPAQKLLQWGGHWQDARSATEIIRDVKEPLSGARKHWAEAFRRMAERGDDSLLDREDLQPTQWDKTEWKW